MNPEESYLHTMLTMEAAHQVIHGLQNDEEENLFVSLCEREVILLGLALACLWFDYPCLAEDSRDLQSRFVELAKAQKPDWMSEEEEVGE